MTEKSRKDHDKLANFILDDLLNWFKDERQNLLEEQWRRNYAAFRGNHESGDLKKWRATEGNKWRSSVFVRLTKQKVMTGFNHVRSFTTQGGDLAWDLTHTPIPELAPGQEMQKQRAEKAALGMKRVIKDNFVETRIENPFLSNVLESAIYGISSVVSPVVRQHQEIRAVHKLPAGLRDLNIDPEIAYRYGRYQMQAKTILRPTTIAPGIWNTFWDLENPDVQKGQGVIIRDMMSRGRFIELLSRDGYDKEAIKDVVDSFDAADESDTDEFDDSHGPTLEEFNKRKRVIQVYYFWGRVPVDNLRESDTEGMGDVAKNKRELEVYCVVAKGKTARTIRRPVLNPLFMRPTHLSPWESLPQEAGGVGIPENMEDSQMIVNGLTRAVLDNKALASNLLTFLNPRNLAPGQNMALYPGKTFEVQEGVEDVRKAMGFFSPPDNTGNSMNLIQMFREFADTETGLARTMEGVQSPGQQTAFEISKLTQSGNMMISGTIQNFDEHQIEPIVRSHYYYQMLTNDDEAIKGDYQVKAMGFTSYQDRSTRAKNLLQLFQLGLSNQLTAPKTNADEFLKELARINDVDPDKFFNFDDQQLGQQTEELAKLLPGTGGQQS